LVSHLLRFCRFFLSPPLFFVVSFVVPEHAKIKSKNAQLQKNTYRLRHHADKQLKKEEEENCLKIFKKKQ